MHVLIIDDDTGLTTMLAEYLGAEGFTSDVAHTGEQGVGLVRTETYNAVLLDVMLPGVGGIEALRQIRQFSDVPVIMLTAKGDDVDRVVGLEAGADDYIPKPYFPRELVARLRAVLRRSSPAQPDDAAEELVNGSLRLHPDRYRAWLGETELPLTTSELSILELLMRSVDRVVTKDDISREVLGRPHFAYDRSVDVHISNIRQKLDAAKPGLDLIQTVRGVGYRLRLNP